MVKKGLAVVLVASILAGCNTSPKAVVEPNKNISTTSSETKNDLRLQNLALVNDSVFKTNSWYKYYHNLDTSFALSAFTFNNMDHEALIVGTDDVPDKAFYDAYSKFIVYNKSKTKFVDFDSYGEGLVKHKDGSIVMEGGEIDSETDVVDLNEKTRQRIFFCGTYCFVEQAMWVDDSTVALMGTSSNDESGPIFNNIWIVDLTTNRHAHFLRNIAIPVKPSNYLWNVHLKGVKHEEATN